jgi:hypothetical protein
VRGTAFVPEQSAPVSRIERNLRKLTR